MADSICAAEGKSEGDLNRPDSRANRVLLNLQAEDGHQNPSRSLSPDVAYVNRKASSSQDLHLSAKGPRCSHDLHTGPTIEYKSGLDTFVFPTPSPRLPSPSPRHSPRLPPRSVTPQLQAASDRLREPQRIGMAIGSPSQAAPTWGRSQTADCISTRIQQRPPPHADSKEPEKQPPRKITKKQQRASKTSSWRLFSNLFKKSTKPELAQSNRVSKHPVYKENLQAPPNQSTDPPNVKFQTPTATLPHSATLPVMPSGPSRPSHIRTLSDSKAPPRCESRSSVRTSFTRMLRSPCERTTPSLSPWRGSLFRSESPQPDISTSATIVRTPRLELDLPKPELDRYSVMFFHLLAPTASNEYRPTLLERRLSRMPTASKDTSPVDIAQHETNCSPSGQQSQAKVQPRRPLSIRVGPRRNTSSVLGVATQRPQSIMRSHTAPMYETCQQPASSPESHAESASHSDASVPATPTTLNNCIDDATIPLKQEHEPTWTKLISQPVIMDSTDSTHGGVNPLIDLERQMVQVSVARQVSISHARSRIRRTVSTQRPEMVSLAMAKNRKSEVAILDSVEYLHDAAEEEMPDGTLIKEFSTL